MTGKPWIRLAGTLATVTAVAGTLMIAGATSAQAHERVSTVFAGNVVLGRGYVDAGHHYIKTCDEAPDDRGVRTYYWTYQGQSGLVGDANGSASPCSERRVSASGDPVVRIRTCAGRDGRDEYCDNQTVGA